MLEKIIIGIAFTLYGLVFAGGLAWAIIKDKVVGLEDYLKQKELDRNVDRLKNNEGNYVGRCN